MIIPPVPTHVEFVNPTELSDLFARAPKKLRAELVPAVHQAGELVAGQARSNANWSTRIPGAISVKASMSIGATAGATVKVNSGAAPHARPYEGVGGAGSFRHSSYGRTDRKWITQATRPFLIPAGKQKKGAALLLMRDALRRSLS